MASIQGVYVALFGRPADPTGLTFFKGVTADGADLTAIGDLSASAEYKARFEGKSNVEIINDIYMSLFGHGADAAGLAFFAAALASGAQTINTIAINILDGAQGTDKTIVDLKIAAADAYTAALDTGAEIVAYSGTAAAKAGLDFLATVTTTAPTAAEIDAAVASMVTGSENPAGSIFTLTAAANVQTGGVDNVVGTDGNDTFRAVVANSLDSTDIIDGKGGNDVLEIDADGLLTGAAPVITNVERINNAEAGATLNLASAQTVSQVWSSGLVGTYTYADGALSQIFGASNAGAKTVDVSIQASTAGTADTLNIAVDDNNGDLATFASTDDAASIEGISVAALGGAGSGATGDAIDDLVDIQAFTGLKTITVTGAGDVNIDASAVGQTAIKTIDTSAATGTVTVDASGSTVVITATGGAGSDVITTGTGADVINTGAGKDTIVAGAGNDTINGGAGSDTMTGNAGNDAFGVETASALLGDIDFITDFTVADDTLDFNGPVGSASNFTSIAANAASFNDAREAANGLLDGTVLYAAVDNGASTWVFYDSGADGTADMAVQLTGVADATTITSAMFIA
jgi:Ca2+-binding RTX toxin-like protein